MSIEKYDFNEFKKEGLPFSFTLLSNPVLQNVPNALALAAWCYLSSKPEQWIPSKAEIAKHFGIGKNKVKQLFSYLHDNYLISYEQFRNPNGTIKSTTLICKNGMEFIKKIINKQTDDTRGPESVPVVLSTGTSIHRHGYHAACCETPIKERINIKEKEKRESAKKTRSPLSLDFIPNEENIELFEATSQSSGLSFESLFEKFKTLSKNKLKPNWDDEFKLFLLRERPASKKSENIKQNNEIRSTVKQWTGSIHNSELKKTKGVMEKHMDLSYKAMGINREERRKQNMNY